ncbi:hypothetical protein [Roseateles sp. L2-2]|uniref:hypothetical protein n=1 Tax=Roseateles sp. L2-2 TaxID=3422597 RepID=UPI003D366495
MHPIASSPLLPTSEPTAARNRPPTRFDDLSAVAADIVSELWDCAHPHVDLRRFAPAAFEEIPSFWLTHCEEARFVALPSHCPVSAIHTLMLGLPALEGLLLWSPGGTAPINAALGRHLRTVIADLPTLSRVMSPAGVKLVACGTEDLPANALAWQAACNTRPRRTWPPGRPQWPEDRAARTLSMVEASLHACTRNDAVAYRLANWTASGTDNSRPSSPEALVPRREPAAFAHEAARGSTAPSSKQLRQRTLQRIQSSCEALIRRLPSLPSLAPRRSRSI